MRKLLQIDMEKTGENIHCLMREKGISTKKIQEELNLGCIQSVYSWLWGRNLPTVDNLVNLAEIFGVSIDDILVVKILD